jgi:hypothetical protein
MSMARDFQCFFKYVCQSPQLVSLNALLLFVFETDDRGLTLGNSTPMAKTPMARTTRVTSSVISLTFSLFSSCPPPHAWGFSRSIA